MPSFHKHGKTAHGELTQSAPDGNHKNSTYQEPGSFCLAKYILLREGTPAPLRHCSWNNPCFFHTYESPKIWANVPLCCPMLSAHWLLAGCFHSLKCTPNMFFCEKKPIWHDNTFYSKTWKGSTKQAWAISAWQELHKFQETRVWVFPPCKVCSSQRKNTSTNMWLL